MEKSLELLSQVSTIIVSDRVLEEILQFTVRITASSLGFKLCSIWLLDPPKNTLVLKATQSLSEAYRNRPPLPASEGISGVALRERQPIAVPDVRKDPRFSRPDLARSEGLVSMLSVPMISGGRSLGVLNVYSSEPHAFSGEEMAVLQSVANQAAVALERVQDTLTGTYNRRYLDDRGVERYILGKDNANIPVALILLDIDFFKIINDLHGHGAGDEALKEVARVLRLILRSTDVIIRYGGDEFLLLLPAETRQGAHRVLEKAMHSVVSIVLRGREGKRIHLSISGGVSVFPEDGENFRELLEKADWELSLAKKLRFDRV